MPTTDTSEKGLEALIVRSLIDEAGYVAGDSKDFDRDHALGRVCIHLSQSSAETR
jgi:type I restriction enzyme R subunit